MQRQRATHLGAYGLAVVGLEHAAAALSEAAPEWPVVRVAAERGKAVDAPLALSASRASYPTARGSALLDRVAGTVTYRGPDPADPDELVHPLLGMAGAVWAQWLGREAFHAGAFAASGGAWAVVGDREAGKSTLMAALAVAGADVLCDDTLVLERGECLAGARCVDLRGDAPELLGVADRALPVRRGERRRLPLPSPPAPSPLRGWLFLTWADEVALVPIQPRERFRRIAALARWHRRGVTDHRRLLELAALPAWELRRPREWAALPETVALVGEATWAR